MQPFTSSLPTQILEELNTLSQRLNVPKNQIILEALTKYFNELERKAFEASFERVAQDSEMSEIAETGLSDYIDQLSALDVAS